MVEGAVADRVRAATEPLAERVGRLEVTAAALQDENLRLRNLSHHDDLTGLGNRRSFELQLEKAIDNRVGAASCGG